MSIIPFKIEISQDRISRLKQKLALTDYPNDIFNSDDTWSRGVPLPEIKRLAGHWQTNFDWERVVAKLNEIPQFTAEIDVDGYDTHDIHFVHQVSDVTGGIPLLFLHGWPGSIIEVTKILPGLLNGGDGFDHPTFHVVAPSLIDFGFSSASSREDFNVDQHAEAYHKLMLKLGYTEYVIQAGDVGSLIARFIAMKYGPTHCKAYHVNSAVPAQPTAETHPDLYAKTQTTPLTQAEVAGLQRSATFLDDGSGYYKQQSTRPQTLGFSLRDSPVGLLAWIYEKLHDWADRYPWTDDEILTWVSIYYFSRAGPDKSSSIYYAMEHRQPPAFPASQIYIDVPLGITRFSNDVVLLPKLWNQSLGPIVFEREHDGGGHFAAWEHPEVIVDDLRNMFGRHGAAYACVTGRSGYASVEK